MTDYTSIEKPLNLPEFRVTDLKQNEHNMAIYVEVKERPTVCPNCGVIGSVGDSNGGRTQKVRDFNSQGKLVTLFINRRSFKCNECNSFFTEPLQSVRDRARLTDRFREDIALKARVRPFIEIEREYAISDTTIRKAFLEDVRTLPTLAQIETPRVLGIDEIHLTKGDYKRKTPWAVIGNGEERTVMDMLKNNNNPTVRAAFKQLQQPERVKVITMDMKAGYRTVAREVFPHVFIVIDKFHVVRMASDALDFIRRQCSKTASPALKKNKNIFLMREDKLSINSKALRDEWFEEYPILKAAYELKEDFYRMYDCQSRADAEYYYSDWKQRIPDNLPGFKMLCKTINRRHEDIFNYFDAPFTNAFVEGLNRAIRLISNKGGGYTFEVLRGKVLFTAGRKMVVQKVDYRNMSMMIPSSFDDTLSRSYGIPFAAIEKAANAGVYD